MFDHVYVGSVVINAIGKTIKKCNWVRSLRRREASRSLLVDFMFFMFYYFVISFILQCLMCVCRMEFVVLHQLVILYVVCYGYLFYV